MQRAKMNRRPPTGDGRAPAYTSVWPWMVIVSVALAPVVPSLAV
jgi:hypothetical protein